MPKHTKKKSFKGGKMLDSGAFGCVYYPSLKCSGEQERTAGISKLMRSKDADIELEEFAVIDAIDPTFQYHLPTPTKCTLGDVDQEDDNMLKDCKLISEDYNPENFALLQMVNGGVSIWQYLGYIRDDPHMRTNLELKKFFFGMENLFKGLVDFAENNYINIDIKTDNILYNPTTHRFNFIDFGQCATGIAIIPKILIGYFTTPLDILILTSQEDLLKQVDTIPNIITAIKKHMKYTYTQSKSINHIVEKQYINTHKLKSKSIFYDLSRNHIPETVHNFITTPEQFQIEYLNKISMFSMGIVLIEILYSFTGQKWPSDYTLPFANTISKLILRMIDPFYQNRISPNQFFNTFIRLKHKNPIQSSHLQTEVTPSGAAASGAGSDLSALQWIPPTHIPLAKVTSNYALSGEYIPRGGRNKTKQSKQSKQRKQTKRRKQSKRIKQTKRRKQIKQRNTKK